MVVTAATRVSPQNQTNTLHKENPAAICFFSENLGLWDHLRAFAGFPFLQSGKLGDSPNVFIIFAVCIHQIFPVFFLFCSGTCDVFVALCFWGDFHVFRQEEN